MIATSPLPLRPAYTGRRCSRSSTRGGHRRVTSMGPGTHQEHTSVGRPPPAPPVGARSRAFTHRRRGASQRRTDLSHTEASADTTFPPGGNANNVNNNNTNQAYPPGENGQQGSHTHGGHVQRPQCLLHGGSVYLQGNERLQLGSSGIGYTPPSPGNRFTMTDTNRNPQAFPTTVRRTTLLTPTSPVTIWNRQVDQLQHGFSPTLTATFTPAAALLATDASNTPTSTRGGTCPKHAVTPPGGATRPGEQLALREDPVREESNSSGESTPVASPEDREGAGGEDDEEEEDTPTVSLSWDCPWSPDTKDTTRLLTPDDNHPPTGTSQAPSDCRDSSNNSRTKCLHQQQQQIKPPYPCPRHPHRLLSTKAHPYTILSPEAKLEELANRNLGLRAMTLEEEDEDGLPVLARSSSAALELMTAALPSLSRCRITRNPLLTDPLRGGDGYILRPLPPGRTSWSVPATPMQGSGCRVGGGKQAQELLGGTPCRPHRVLPYLLSPLTPCRDPFLYLKVFEAVARCTETLSVR